MSLNIGEHRLRCSFNPAGENRYIDNTICKTDMRDNDVRRSIIPLMVTATINFILICIPATSNNRPSIRSLRLFAPVHPRHLGGPTDFYGWGRISGELTSRLPRVRGPSPIYVRIGTHIFVTDADLNATRVPRLILRRGHTH
jgi:hypothetical protein